MRQLFKPVRLFPLLFIGILATERASCQTKPMRTVFESNEVDSATGLEETKVYRLKKEAVNADFTYTKLCDMDANVKDGVTLLNLMPIFNPIHGRYRYYQFVATFKGEGYRGIGEFHDILIIKTRNDGKIVDAYQYTLEWAELPLQVDLYRSSAKDIFLKDNLDISQLKFIRYYSDVEDNEELKEKGIIKLK